MTEKEKIDYIKAAKVVANCRNDRLPYVLEILRSAGYEFSEETLAMCMNRKGSDVLRERRGAENKDDWQDTEDEVSIALRNAYDEGISFTEISRKCGVGRSLLYLYMKGERKIPAERGARILAVLRESEA